MKNNGSIRFAFIIFFALTFNAYCKRPFFVMIPKNTTIFDIKKAQDIKVHKNLIARALVKSLQNNFLTILNQQGTPVYLVQSHKIIPFDKDLNIFSKSTKLLNKTKWINKNIVDKEINLAHEISLNGQVIPGDLFKQLVNKKEENLSIKNTFFSWELYYFSKLPLDLGLTANISQGRGENNATLSQLDTGIVIKTKKLSLKNWPSLQLSFYGLQTIYQKLNLFNSKFYLSTNFLRLKISTSFSLPKIGNYLLGFSASKYTTSIQNWQSKKITDINDRAYFSYGLFIGHQFKTPFML